MPTEPRHYQVTPNSNSHYSWLRTRMSAERTLMSWLRTSLAMIGFGFTVAKFFDQLASAGGVDEALFPPAPKYLGLGLIAVGTLALLIATIQYRRLLDHLWSDTFRAIAPDRRRLSSAYSMTLIALSAGLLIFVFCLF
jgi:putative membrane protein